MSFSPFRRNTVVDNVFQELKKRIISNEYEAGFQLRQDSLANELGVSRIPLREALLRLEAEGLIEIVAHKGGVVRSLSQKEAAELFNLRILIECDLMKQAVPKMSDDDLDQAEVALKKFDKMVISGENIDNWTKLNWDFHYQFYKPADQPNTIKILQMLHSNTDRYIRQQLLEEGAPERAHEEHNELIELCRKGDVDGACLLLKQHINATFEQIKPHLS
ncbi:GntR family transcriptional regulator [Pseudemcibacter aquimaris]|uniref:GntR family transcriptional regulator n=1 Tax=Pseudemcibacter aquimaris TaxID=2857064 RepID=UPI0020114A5F|nr:GntR family transcriptional regulator [Pseudemcibacter aquimaris]MCC3862418.1 GntR family transcriptional regulator [Pseudemcibacter aquimaris]WDU59152.1 GntR family transcriptional regulator [Pseudemcibacter aquimaris]